MLGIAAVACVVAAVLPVLASILLYYVPQQLTTIPLKTRQAEFFGLNFTWPAAPIGATMLLAAASVLGIVAVRLTRQ